MIIPPNNEITKNKNKKQLEKLLAKTNHIPKMLIKFHSKTTFTPPTPWFYRRWVGKNLSNITICPNERKNCGTSLFT